ncbi:hypothetical protein E2C01_031240 [Portunus trituberculatus]|uniref:Uncharacterized protein n=1 Tax=Portunus trituberculatus TaxID=210409 RepID=A0A5B7EXK7_PORTR|nr:hypothetical protein [Portunus trituberculatus]
MRPGRQREATQQSTLITPPYLLSPHLSDLCVTSERVVTSQPPIHPHSAPSLAGNTFDYLAVTQTSSPHLDITNRGEDERLPTYAHSLTFTHKRNKSKKTTTNVALQTTLHHSSCERNPALQYCCSTHRNVHTGCSSQVQPPVNQQRSMHVFTTTTNTNTTTAANNTDE